eukprot:1582227-Amphidinium_carterae.1
MTASSEHTVSSSMPADAFVIPLESPPGCESACECIDRHTVHGKQLSVHWILKMIGRRQGSSTHYGEAMFTTWSECWLLLVTEQGALFALSTASFFQLLLY